MSILYIKEPKRDVPRSYPTIRAKYQAIRKCLAIIARRRDDKATRIQYLIVTLEKLITGITAGDVSMEDAVVRLRSALSLIVEIGQDLARAAELLEEVSDAKREKRNAIRS
jgi:exonuclease VII small subunit